MKRLLVLAVVFAGLASSDAYAAAADLYTVAGVEVDATAESATAARDRALAQGRPAAWQRLFRRLTPPSAWPRQFYPGNQELLRMIRSLEVVNERRSTTRYLAEITYHFDGAEVQRVLRQAAVPYAVTQARPILVIPLMQNAQTRASVYDSTSPWTEAWATPSIAQGLVPVILPQGDALDQFVLARPNLAQLGWEDLQPLADRYGVAQIVIASTTRDGLSTQLDFIDATGRRIDSLAFARSNLVATADAAAQRIAEPWKARAAVDYSRRDVLTADVAFANPADWPRIRARLAAVRSIVEVNLLGLSLHEARLELTYFGQPDQLSDAMAQQNLAFSAESTGYLLRLGNAAAAIRQ